MAATLTHSRQLRNVRRASAWMAAVPLLSLLWPAPPGLASELEPVPGSPAARALGLKDLGDRVHQLDDYVGQVILVNFWGTWCPPCVAEMPSLQSLKTAFAGRPFALLAVNMGEGKRRVQQFRKTAGIDFTLLLDPSSEVSQRWAVNFVPANFLIDAQGRVRYQAFGEVAWDDDDVRATVGKLINEAGPASAD